MKSSNDFDARWIDRHTGCFVRHVKRLCLFYSIYYIKNADGIIQSWDRICTFYFTSIYCLFWSNVLSITGFCKDSRSRTNNTSIDSINPILNHNRNNITYIIDCTVQSSTWPSFSNPCDHWLWKWRQLDLRIRSTSHWVGTYPCRSPLWHAHNIPVHFTSRMCCWNCIRFYLGCPSFRLPDAGDSLWSSQWAIHNNYIFNVCVAWLLVCWYLSGLMSGISLCA